MHKANTVLKRRLLSFTVPKLTLKKPLVSHFKSKQGWRKACLFGVPIASSKKVHTKRLPSVKKLDARNTSLYKFKNIFVRRLAWGHHILLEESVTTDVSIFGMEPTLLTKLENN